MRGLAALPFMVEMDAELAARSAERVAIMWARTPIHRSQATNRHLVVVTNGQA
jgi:hypothetical protein